MERIEWHPGFQAGLELRLRAYKERLIYRHEYPLTKRPIVVDTLVIEKTEDVVIDDDVAAIFLRHNIVEYKNPDDALSIDEYYDLMAYMARYKAGTGKTDAVKADEVTGTLMRQRRPEEMFREIVRLGGRVERRYAGVYYIEGLVHMPTQVIVQSELDGPENAVLRILTKAARQDDVKAFVGETLKYTERDDRDNADAVYQVSVSANRELYDRLKRSDPEVCTALKELMKEEMQEEILKAEQRGEQIGEQRGEQIGEQKGANKGFARAIIGLVRDRIITAETGAERLHITVDEMNVLAAEN